MNISIIHITVFAFVCSFLGYMGGFILMGCTKPRSFAVILEFTAGAVLSLVFFTVLPLALSLTSGMVVFPAFCLGIILAVFLQDMVRFRNPALFYALALAGYNLPSGIALGCGVTVGADVGILMGCTTFFTHLPHGASLFKLCGRRAVWLFILAALPILPGACIGALIGHISGKTMGLVLSLGAGILLYAGAGTLIPLAVKSYPGRGGSIGLMAGVLFGLLCIMI